MSVPACNQDEGHPWPATRFRNSGTPGKESRDLAPQQPRPVPFDRFLCADVLQASVSRGVDRGAPLDDPEHPKFTEANKPWKPWKHGNPGNMQETWKKLILWNLILFQGFHTFHVL